MVKTVMSAVMHTHFKVLSPEERESFMEKGYVIIREAFSPDTAAALARHVWEMIPEDPDDRTTWTRAAAEIQQLLTQGPVADIFTPRYTAAVDDLLGEGRWYTNRDSYGWIPVRFPGFSVPPWSPPRQGWHVDGMNFHHRLTSRELGLAGMEFFSDIQEGGGGTALQVGSHKYVARLLEEKGAEGLSYKELFAIAGSATGFPVEEATGRAGDVLWMHPFLIHARSPNVTGQVRIAANRTISLYENPDPWRKSGHALSFLELTIRQALK